MTAVEGGLEGALDFIVMLFADAVGSLPCDCFHLQSHNITEGLFRAFTILCATRIRWGVEARSNHSGI